MQTTLTLNKVTTADPVMFNWRKTDGNGVVYYDGGSAQGDLAGRPSIKVATTKTRAGIIARTAHITWPVWNADKGVYEGTVQSRVVLNSPATTSVALALDVMNILLSAFYSVENEVFRDEFANAQM